jgi:hypothetical protein
MAAFWGAAPCSLVEVFQRCRGTCCSIFRAMMMEAEKASENVGERLLGVQPRIQPSSETNNYVIKFLILKYVLKFKEF